MRAWIWSISKCILFKVDAEAVHHFALRMIRLLGWGGNLPLRIVSGARAPASSPRPVVLGMEFASRLGLAAGFDKNCDILTGLPALGFGFAEIGTVTPRPQPGNPRPRLFRDPAQGALFNRMGFNSLGAELVARRLGSMRAKLPSTFRVGVNIGKNKETPQEAAAQDYSLAIQPFRDLADYVVVNVSSPNTPGLRQLQNAEQLRPIVEKVAQEIGNWRKKPPLLLKLAPELDAEALSELLSALERLGSVDGWVLTNTLAGSWKQGGAEQPIAGGWSGSPVTEASRRSLERARKLTRLPIISVGGIMDSDEANVRLKLGAELIQIYSGWILKGPSFPAEISRKIADFRP